MELIARWESKSKKWFVELYKDSHGYGYRAVGAGGYLGYCDWSDATAIKIMEPRIEDFQPDANKVPMIRTI